LELAGDPDQLRARLSPPSEVAFEITGRCDRRCAFCFNPWTTADAVTPPDLEAAQLVEWIRGAVAATGCQRVQLTGGEPLLRADVLDLVDAVTTAGARPTLATDGARITPELARALATHSIERVQVTLLGADADTHDRLKGAACFDDSVRGLRALVAAGVPCSAAVILLRDNLARLTEILELCFALRLDGVALNRLCAGGRGAAAYARLAPDPEELAAALVAADRTAADLQLPVWMAVGFPPCALPDATRSRLRRIRLGGCALARGAPHWTVGPDGGVRPCGVSGLAAGNLTTESWAEILDHAADRLGDLLILPAECVQCPWAATCCGGCRASATNLFGRPRAPDPLSVPEEMARRES